MRGLFAQEWSEVTRESVSSSSATILQSHATTSKTKETSDTAPTEFVRFARLTEPNQVLLPCGHDRCIMFITSISCWLYAQLDKLHHIDTISLSGKPEVMWNVVA